MVVTSVGGRNLYKATGKMIDTPFNKRQTGRKGDQHCPDGAQMPTNS